MANQNLSQFGENTSVSDADYTFVWDSAASISKKVSRNSWLNSGTLTSDAPVTISQTWAGTGSTVFKALVVNATTPGTTSSSSSLLLDLQVGGVTQASANKSGQISAASFVFAADSGAGLFRSGNNRLDLRLGSTVLAFAGGQANGLYVKNQIGFDSSGDTAGAFNYVQDTILLRDGAANTLALRNGANAQTFNVYGTYTSGTSYERLTLSAPSAANAIIGTNKGSGGGTARGLEFQTDGVTRMTIPAVGGATVNTVAYGNNYINLSPDSINFLLLKRANDTSTVSFYTNSNQSNTLSQGVHSLFELLWSSGVGAGGAYDIGIRRASAGVLQISNTASNTFGFIQGKIRTETAYTATTVVPTGFLTLYDSNGTAYRVPCVAAP